jgi:hypothetical protein
VIREAALNFQERYIGRGRRSGAFSAAKCVTQHNEGNGRKRDNFSPKSTTRQQAR